MTNLIPRAPKRKKQPTAECMRQQLALAADEIIGLRMQLLMERAIYVRSHRPSWWQKLMDEIAETPWEKLPGWARLLSVFRRRKPA